MYLILCTIVYCLLTRFMDMSYDLALGIVLLSVGFLKGYYSDSRKDLFNLASTRELYVKNGFKGTLLELISLLIIYANSYFLDYIAFTPFELIYLFAGFVILYRYLFWGIIRTIQGKLDVS